MRILLSAISLIFLFQECVLLCLHTRCTGTVTRTVHTSCTGARSVCSFFGGNMCYVSMEETPICIGDPEKKTPCLTWPPYPSLELTRESNSRHGKPVLYQPSKPVNNTSAVIYTVSVFYSSCNHHT